MKRALEIAVLAVAVPAIAAVSSRDHRQEQVLASLMASKSAAELRKAHAASEWPDAAVEIVYAVRLKAWKAGDADQALIRAIPRTPVDFWYAYDVFRPHSSPLEQELVRAYSQYWVLAPAAIVRRKAGFREFLLLSRWATSGEMRDELQAANEVLWEGDQVSVLRALESLDAETRALVCNEDGLPCGTKTGQPKRRK